MYSVVFLAVLTGGGSGPAHGHGHPGYPGHGPAAPHGCHGCWGLPYCGYAAWHPPQPHGPPTPGPHASPVIGPGVPATNDTPPASKTEARLVVHLPKGGKLYVDGQLIGDVSDQEELKTPRLERGKEYVYELRAEVVRDGRTLTQTRRVTLRAGETVRAGFPDLDRVLGVASRHPSSDPKTSLAIEK